MSEKSARAVAERQLHDARMPTVDFNLSPFTIAWEVTRACAFSCRHCRAEAHPKADPRELNSAEALALVDQLAAHIAYPITQKTETAVRLAQLARAALADAMAADVNEAGSAAGDRVPEWIAARA